MKHIAKIEPFIENIVIGSLFVTLGFYIMRTFNESSFGLVGLATIMWGGFKIFLGVVIYGIALWALIFRPRSFKDIKKRQAVDRVLKRVDRDIQSNNIRLAIDRLHGVIMNYPNDLQLKLKLARFYVQNGDLARAGRYLYLKPHPTSKEKECISLFERRNGDSAFHILRAITKPSRVDRDFVRESKKKITRLVNAIAADSERKSWIVREYEFYLDELNVPLYKKMWNEQRDVVVHVFMLIVLFCLAEILAKS